MIDPNLTNYYRTFHKDGNIPERSISYITLMQQKLNINPKVIYDIGSAVLHWTKNAKCVWPDAKIIAFEAQREVEDFYKEYGIDYAIGVFSDEDEKDVVFYEHPICLGGNSYYRENSYYSKAADDIYDSSHAISRKTHKIDTIVASKNFPKPDLIKIDVQGAELDILKGMQNTLKNVQHMIIELQHVEYNVGAKLNTESIPFIESLGFKLLHPSKIFPEVKDSYFCGNGPDADYHFVRKS